MPVIRTPYDLGAGGISTPDYDAQSRQQQRALQAQILGMALDQQRFMMQMTFNQRQDAWKNAMKEKMFAASQAEAGKMSEKEKASLALAKEEMAFKKDKFQQDQASQAQRDQLTAAHRSQQTQAAAAAKTVSANQAERTDLFRQTQAGYAADERTRAATERGSAQQYRRAREEQSRLDRREDLERQAKQDLATQGLRGQQADLIKLKTEDIFSQREAAKKAEGEDMVKMRPAIEKEFGLKGKVPSSRARSLVETYTTLAQADQDTENIVSGDIMKVFSSEIKKITESKGSPKFSPKEWEIFNLKAKRWTGGNPQKAKALKTFIDKMFEKLPLTPKPRGMWPLEPMLQSIFPSYKQESQQQGLKDVQESYGAQEALKKKIYKSLWGQNI